MTKRRTVLMLVLTAGLLMCGSVFARQVTMPTLVDFHGELEDGACLAQYEKEAATLKSIYGLDLILGPERRTGSGSSLRRHDITIKNLGLSNLETKEAIPFKVGEVEYLGLIYKDGKPSCNINISYIPIAIEKLNK